ncbi:lysophospholipid acyltransferase family protein [Paludibacterium purpuratum]|uniref:1-acyl-sn-glycerol-3-phosphate acyltransferase n=1 Tax=Paludibacterium purpuratum TaxID=1144873 RepID=A0A4R7B4N0_9NEIS|nr:lysophospholipid acyltransferase family protein [Paludibacterium purpuratum]TDR77803.1 1-acyl-sn-glycerol-3-phosphate acyltransferase [Paludibacterium purpuratum]
MLNHIHRVHQIVLFYTMLLWLGSMLLLGNLLALPLVVAPRSLREPLVRGTISLICRTFLDGAQACGLMRLDLSALDTLNGRTHLLLVPNHPSMIDAFLVLSRVRQAVCLMKASISGNLFLGAGAHLAGYVSNRHPGRMFRQAIDSVAEGKLLMIFPEGTRTVHQPINDLQGSVALIAKKARVPLQTILITTNSPYLSKGWKIWRPPVFPLIYRAVPGEQFDADEKLELTAARLQQYFESSMTRSIDPDLR